MGYADFAKPFHAQAVQCLLWHVFTSTGDEALLKMYSHFNEKLSA